MEDSASLSEHTVAVYSTHDQAAAAVKILRDSGHDMKNLTVIGQDYATEERPIGFVNTGDRMWTWGKRGMFWGSLWGLLFASAMVFIPGIGYVMFAGWLVAALEGAVIGGGLAALGGALASIGIPEDTVVKYEAELKAGRYLLLVHGNEDEVQRTKAALARTLPMSVESFTAKSPVATAAP